MGKKENKKRILVFSDVHLNNQSKFSHTTQEGYNSRLLRGISALKEVFDACQSSDYLLCLGDLFDDGRNVRPEMLVPLYELFENLVVPKERRIFIPGQHDFSIGGGLFHSIQILRPFVTVVDDLQPYETEDFVFRYYLNRNPGLSGQITFHEVSKEKPEILLVHALVKEIFAEVGIPPVSGMVSLKEDLRPLKRTAAIFCGDYHNHVITTFGKAKKPLVSVGPLLPNSFKDEKSGGHGAYWVYEIDPKGDLGDFYIEQRVTSFSHTFKTITSSKEIKKGLPDNGFYRIHFQTQEDYLQFKQKFGDQYCVDPVLEGNKDKVEVKSRLDVTFDMEPVAVIRRYCDFVGESDMAEMGLEYLKRSES